ncbi:MAG TPA: PQQ-binding-like beta-propeller repeat protein [Tepidisphaeraceae bacterium]|jgi:outer membrane protein assembly factor BamB
MRTLRAFIGLLFLAVIVPCAPARAAEPNWPQWRGPNYNGSTSATNLPDKIAREDALWSTPMPGHSNGTPIIWGDRIFTTAQQRDGKLVALCVSRTDGKIVWQRDISDVSVTKGRNDSATPSPVTDGKQVFFLYGTGDLAAFDVDGKPLWQRNIPKQYGRWNYQWHYGASPTLYKGKLYVQVLHRDVSESNWGDSKPGGSLADSYLLGVDPATGKDLWRVIRPTDARVESHEAYTTPIPWERPGGTQILIAGGDCVTGHDPETGKELWRAGGWNPQKVNSWRLVTSPVTWDGLVFVCPPKGGPILAFKEGGSGDVTNTHRAWKGDNRLTSDVCVPLVYKDNLYVLDGDRKQLFCVDPKTGTHKWGGTLDSRNAVLRTSPTGADGKIYVMNENGDLFVCSADEFKVHSKASLGGEGGSRGSIAAVDGMIVVRTGDKLWAFGKKQ